MTTPQRPESLRRFHGSTGLPCRDCNCPHDEYAVDSALWNLVMRPEGHETEYEYLCLACFHRRVKAYIDGLASDLARAKRQEQWVFNYAKQRVDILERALWLIGTSRYISVRWVRRAVSSALFRYPNHLTCSSVESAKTPNPEGTVNDQ